MTEVVAALAVSVDDSSAAGTPDPAPTHRPIPDAPPTQTIGTPGVEAAIAAARKRAGSRGVALVGGGLLSAVLR